METGANRDAKELMQKIGYEFKNEEYLEEALTHRSYSNETEKDRRFNNEKLEFLGDAVVNLITTEYIYELYEKKTEGELAKLKSQIISEPVFSTIASDIELGEYLYLSNGEIMSGGRNRRSILGDAFEALIGAIFKDSDYYTAKNVALKLLLGKINKLEEIEGTGDYKTVLQEFVQGKYRKMPEYKLLNTKGPDHDKVFEISVSWNDKIYGVGTGKSKKEAEKHAAKEALAKLKKQKQ
ncbi:MULTISPECIES: ribonuclease III [unclassified Leptotrichia]|uniref:ribonuclease III n=1 Tax=unclassified Leptotrichia TaxID=2633022 RepID=UPI0003AE3EE1|nr:MULTISPECIES: ribonuclease III [unclassified Leptotrichia]ERL25864.1 ribonuclease III [Leptotrichia sp. oral taxon 225 str. F0581]WLD73758.1 ribonuclease III [Leptotrichia sp. HMT-225]